MEKSLTKMREMAQMRGQAESFSDDCASYIVEQIIGTKGLTEEE